MPRRGVAPHLLSGKRHKASGCSAINSACPSTVALEPAPATQQQLPPVDGGGGAATSDDRTYDDGTMGNCLRSRRLRGPMMELPEIASREEWLAARKRVLVQEKEFTRARDALAAERRRLPMVRVDKPYLFGSVAGPVSLLDMFEGRRQLIMHH